MYLKRATAYGCLEDAQNLVNDCAAAEMIAADYSEEGLSEEIKKQLDLIKKMKTSYPGAAGLVPEVDEEEELEEEPEEGSWLYKRALMQDLNRIESALSSPMDVLSKDRGASSLKKITPFMGVFRKKIDDDSEEFKKIQGVKDSVVQKAKFILQLRGYNTSTDEGKIAATVLALVGDLDSLKHLAEWRDFIRPFASVNDDIRLKAFKEAMAGNEMERAFLRCCLTYMNEIPERTINLNRSLIYENDTLEYSYNYYISHGIWLRIGSYTPYAKTERLREPIYMTSKTTWPQGWGWRDGGGKRRAIGTRHPIDHVKLYMKRQRRMFGVKKYLASEPGIINIAWIETESKKIPIDRMYLPESEVEDWAFYTARLPETHAATVPVIPDPKKYGKIVNGLK